jgi:hypothetical protein
LDFRGSSLSFWFFLSPFAFFPIAQIEVMGSNNRIDSRLLHLDGGDDPDSPETEVIGYVISPSSSSSSCTALCFALESCNPSHLQWVVIKLVSWDWQSSIFFLASKSFSPFAQLLRNALCYEESGQVQKKLICAFGSVLKGEEEARSTSFYWREKWKRSTTF